MKPNRSAVLDTANTSDEEMSTKDYDGFFQPHEYLNTYYKDPKQMQYGYQQLIKFCSQLKQADIKLLEYGGGPVISRLISACPHVKDIVFAEYLDSNRKAVQEWINKDPNAFDWKPVFNRIVQELEGKGPDEVAKRENELRQKIRAVVPCNLTAENILEIPSNLADKYGPPYNVVYSGLCLGAMLESEQEYKDAVTKLAKLVKPGGYLVLYGILECTFFTVGTKKLYDFYLTKEMVEESMKNAGVKDITIDLASSNGQNIDFMPFSDMKDEIFAYGRVGL